MFPEIIVSIVVWVLHFEFLLEAPTIHMLDLLCLSSIFDTLFEYLPPFHFIWVYMALIYVVLPPSIHPLPPTEFVWELVMVSFYCLYFYKISFPKYFEGMIQKNFSNFTKFFSVFFFPPIMLNIMATCFLILSGSAKRSHFCLDPLFPLSLLPPLLFCSQKDVKNWQVMTTQTTMCITSLLIIPIIQTGNGDTEYWSNFPKGTNC